MFGNGICIWQDTKFQTHKMDRYTHTYYPQLIASEICLMEHNINEFQTGSELLTFENWERKSEIVLHLGEC